MLRESSRPETEVCRGGVSLSSGGMKISGGAARSQWSTRLAGRMEVDSAPFESERWHVIFRARVMNDKLVTEGCPGPLLVICFDG